jgi:hypothetical protein
MKIRRDLPHRSRAVELDVQIPRARNLDARDTLNIGGTQLRRKLRSDYAWGLAQPLRQLKRDRQSKLAHGDLRRLFDDKLRQRYIVFFEKNALDPGQKLLLNCAIHAC